MLTHGGAAIPLWLDDGGDGHNSNAIMYNISASLVPCFYRESKSMGSYTNIQLRELIMQGALAAASFFLQTFDMQPAPWNRSCSMSPTRCMDVCLPDSFR